MILSKCKQAFHVDGSLRDIVIQGKTTLSNWEKLICFAGNFETAVLIDSERADRDLNAVKLFEEARHSAVTLSIYLDGLLLNCIMGSVDWMELDLDPREVASEQDFQNIMRFITELGTRLRKDITVTEEMSPNEVWFRYEASKDSLRYFDILA